MKADVSIAAGVEEGEANSLLADSTSWSPPMRNAATWVEMDAVAALVVVAAVTR